MRIRSTTAAVILTASTLIGTVSAATPSIADSSKTCDVASMARVIKGREPVVLVHGLFGHASAWGSTSDPNSMISALKKLSGVYVDEPFDYSSTNTRWVTDDNNGPRLARRIDCLAQASGRKPAVLAHSMGGNDARLAASLTVKGHKVGNEFGLLVTLGTPNLGSGWANVGTDLIRSLCPSRTIMDTSLCDFGQISALKGLRDNGSDIKNLPWMPRSVPVLALAGDVSLGVNIFNSHFTHNTKSDLVVSQHSALQDIRTTSAGGGSKSFACTMDVGQWLPNCWHSALTSNRDVIQTAVDAVKRFASATKPNPYAKYTAAHWHRHESGFDVHTDHTAKIHIGLGASGADGCGFWCSFEATLKVTANSDGSLTGTYTTVQFMGADTADSKPHNVVPPNSVSDLFPHVGDTTIISTMSDNRLHISGLGNPGSVWCSPSSKDNCGA